jgi:hypothetical protein
METRKQMGDGKTEGLGNQGKTVTGYTTLRMSHVYLYACVYIVALGTAFFLGSIY